MYRQGYTKETERALVFTLRHEGKSWAEIEAHPLVTMKRSAIKRWARRGDEGGLNNLASLPKTGRPRATTAELDTDLVASVEASSKTAVTTVVREVIPDYPASMRTARWRCHEAGVHHRRAAKKPFLTNGHKQARLQFAMENVNRDQEFWDSMFWSDEKTWRSDANERVTLWRRPGTRYEPENVVQTTASGHVTAGFWGCVSVQGGAVALTPTTPRMNAAEYIDILRDVFLPAARALRPAGGIRFMHDNAAVHTARATRTFLQEQPGVEVIYWPPNSPDLNPIEHVWAQCVQVWEPRQERTAAALRHHVEDEWRFWQNNPAQLLPLIRSMPQRLQEVIDTQGAHTHY